MLQPVLAPGTKIWRYVVEFAEASTKLDMSLVVQSCISKDDYTILGLIRVSPLHVLTNRNASLGLRPTNLGGRRTNFGEDFVAERSGEVDAVNLCSEG